MKLTVLVDNNTYIDKYLFAEPGLSYFIEVDNKRILFDCGYSDIFIKNSIKLGINLKHLDYLVLSHNHQDHTWGLNELLKLYNDAVNLGETIEPSALIAHSSIFRNTFLQGIGELGLSTSKDILKSYFKIKLSDGPINITDRLYYLGEIPRNNNFENLESIGVNAHNNSPDFMLDDTVLAYKTNEGLIIITACSHAGICNICEYAKKVCQEDRILEIIGGLHLLNPSVKQIAGTVDYIKGLGLKKLYACHCTDLNAKIKLSEVAPTGEVGAGLILEY